MRFGQVKWFASIVVVLLLASLMAGCSSKSNSSSTTGSGDPQINLHISWWGSQDRNDRTLKVVKMYENLHPNIKITPEFLSWDGYWQKLATEAAGKNLPDIIQMDYAYIDQYASKQLIAPLDPFIEANVLDLSDVDANYLDSGKIDGKLYGVNLGANSIAIAYDPEMFKDAGVPEPPADGMSWDDFSAMLKQLKDHLPKGTYAINNMDDMGGFKHYLRENGAWVYNDAGDGLGYTDDKYLVWYFDYFNKLREAGIVPNEETELGVKGLEDSLIVHKKAAMQSFNSNQFVALTSAAGRPLKLMMYPELPGGKPGHFIKPSQFFSIYSGSKHQKEAADFINYFTNDLEANKVLAAERGVPVPSKVREALYPNLSPAEKSTFDYVESVGKVAGPINPPDPERSPKVGDLFTQIQQAVNYGKLTPEQAAKQFREEGMLDLKGQ